MKFNCPSCGAPFDSMGLPVQNVKCPNCNHTFSPEPRTEKRKRSPYTADTEEEAQKILRKISELVTGCDEGVKQCVLWHLEDEWLGNAGHKVTIKVGGNFSVNSVNCSICGRDTIGKGFMLHVISRWRNTTTAIYLCDEHKETPHIHATDVDLQQDNICPELGLY